MTPRSLFPVLTLLTIIGLGSSLPATAAEPILSLDELLKLYRSVGLPEPKTAKLVRYKTGGGKTVNGKVQPICYSLAFELKPQTKTNQAIVLKGASLSHPDWDFESQEIDPDLAVVKDNPVDEDDAFFMAIQCHARGWNKLAQHLLENSKVPSKEEIGQLFIHKAWYYWEKQIFSPDTDRVTAAKFMKFLIAEDKEPNLEPDRNGPSMFGAGQSVNCKANRKLLKSLELAIIPSKGKKGSVEALIDDLVNFYEREPDPYDFYDQESRFWRVARLGFDAVPALIEHLDDERVTRTQLRIVFFPCNIYVQDVVSDILEHLSGLPHDGSENTIDRYPGDPIIKKAAKEWWEEAQKVGEEAYLLKYVLPSEDKERINNNFVNNHQLQLILGKYPKHIPTLYKKMIESRPELPSRSITNAVLRCKIPDKEKLELFLLGTKHKDKDHRQTALDAIQELKKSDQK